MVHITLMVVARGWRHYKYMFSTKGAALEKMVLEKMVTEERSSVLVCEERKPAVCLNLVIIGGRIVV